MKRLVFLVLSILLLSIATLAQTPDASISPTPSPASTLAASSPLPSPVETPTRLPNLHYMVEILACGVMLGSVIVVFLLVRAHQKSRGQTIGPRHIQFVSVCLIVPTVLILGLEQVLSRETTATLIGGLTGYLLSGLGRYEPPKPDNGQRGSGTPNGSASRDGITLEPDDPEPTDSRTKAQRDQARLRHIKQEHGPKPLLPRTPGDETDAGGAV